MEVYTLDEDSKLRLEIKEGVTNIGANFDNIEIEDIEVVSIPASVIIIEENAFSAFTNMEAAFIVNHDSGTKKSKLKTIGNGAFKGCSNLENIEMPNSVTTIGNDAFSGCSALKGSKQFDRIKIPKNVNIGECAFYGCSALTKVEGINKNVTIGNNAFKGCTSLNKETIKQINNINPAALDTESHGGGSRKTKKSTKRKKSTKKKKKKNKSTKKKKKKTTRNK